MTKRRRRLLRPADSWLKWAARFGYAACGLIYVAIGLAAGSVALGISEQTRGARDVILLMARQPFGELLVVALGVGLGGYAALNFAGAINDPERRGVSFHGIVIRTADALTGGLYIAIAVGALRIVVDPEHDGVNTAAEWARGILVLPFGSAVLGLIGAALIGGGVYLLYRAWDEPFGNMLDRRSLSGQARRAVAIAARVGTVARAVIFGICGFFVMRAAASATPGGVADVGDALGAIGRATFGPLLLAVAAAGFIAYGGYQLAKARYQRVTDEGPGTK